MLIGNRLSSWKGGKRLPYDAEVEWLKAGPSQWIDTGIVQTSKMGFEFEGKIEGTSSEMMFCGVVVPSHGITIHNDGNVWAYYNNNSIRTNDGINYLGAFHKYKMDCVNGMKLSIDDNLKLTLNNSTTSNTRTIYVFAGNFGNAYGAAGERTLKYIRILDGTDVIADYIPVRVGSVGYLHDRVSGRLFGNAGTGAFVVGPDKGQKTARDYVQSGLVAMWDGIENAGGGVHDPAATVWKDLVGNHDIVVSPTWTETEFDDSARSLRALIDGDDLPRDAITIEFVVRCPNFANNAFVVDCCDHVTNGIGAFTSSLESPFGIRCSARKSAWTYSVTKKADENYMSFCSVQSDQNGSALYSDGAFFHSFGGMGTPITIWCIGGSATSAYNNFRGYISSIRWYNRRLSADEIAANYAIDKERFGLP